VFAALFPPPDFTRLLSRSKAPLGVVVLAVAGAMSTPFGLTVLDEGDEDSSSSISGGYTDADHGRAVNLAPRSRTGKGYSIGGSGRLRGKANAQASSIGTNVDPASRSIMSMGRMGGDGNGRARATTSFLSDPSMAAAIKHIRATAASARQDAAAQQHRAKSKPPAPSRDMPSSPRTGRVRSGSGAASRHREAARSGAGGRSSPSARRRAGSDGTASTGGKNEETDAMVRSMVGVCVCVVRLGTKRVAVCAVLQECSR